jgi:hypothetical protein
LYIGGKKRKNGIYLPTHKESLLTNPSKQGPQVGGAPILLMHSELGTHPPFEILHSSISVRVCENFIIAFSINSIILIEREEGEIPSQTVWLLLY